VILIVIMAESDKKQFNKENKSGKGYYISSQLKKVVLNRYYDLIKVPKMRKSDIICDIIKLTGISRDSIYKILKNGCVSPKRTKVFKPRNDFKSSDFEKIDSIITEFNKNKVFPAINDVFIKAKSDSTLSFKTCGRTTFYKLIKQMGYKLQNTNKLIRLELMNRADIIGKRIKYLIEKRRLEGLSHISDVIYIDETFVHKNYVKYKILRPLNNSKKIRFKMSIGKGTRFSIIHAGSENGFVAGAEYISINSEINGQIFENWMETKLLPKLSPNSVVIYDNASTHSVQYNKPPVKSSTVKTIKNWLLINKIEYNQSAKKQELLKLVKENTFNNNYNVDDMVNNAGHIPLRLPPYHCILNPIELVWAQLKKIISKHNFNNNTIEFKNLISSAFQKINPTFWQNCIRHVVKIESEFWIHDKIVDNHIHNEHSYCENFFLSSNRFN